jgi:putative hydrolase of the HAD superfamily
MPRAILFDAAGTLIQLARPVGESYATIAGEHGVALPAGRLEDAFARVLRGMPQMCFPDAPCDEIPDLERGWWRELVRQTFPAADSTVRFADFDAFFDALWAYFSAPASWRTRPEVPETLARLRASGTSLGVVSNFDHRLPKLLEGLGIHSEMRCVILPGTHRVAKPDPRVFGPALEALGAGASESVYVGDRAEIDGVAATAAGLGFVDVSQLASFGELPRLLG